MTKLDLVGAKEAATLLGVNRATVNRWVKSGRLSPVSTIGKRNFHVFSRNDVLALAEDKAVSA